MHKEGQVQNSKAAHHLSPTHRPASAAGCTRTVRWGRPSPGCPPSRKRSLRPSVTQPASWRKNPAPLSAVRARAESIEEQLATSDLPAYERLALQLAARGRRPGRKPVAPDEPVARRCSRLPRASSCWGVLATKRGSILKSKCNNFASRRTGIPVVTNSIVGPTVFCGSPHLI